MTQELQNFNKKLQNIVITDEMPDYILNMRLIDLLCKHVFNSSDKAFKLLMASINIGYIYCQWNVANNHIKDFDYDMNRILKIEQDNYNHALRIVACKYVFSDNIYYWCDNIHSAIKYIRQYGTDIRLKDLPFYVVYSGFPTKIITYKNSIRLDTKDVEGIMVSATQRFLWSNSRNILDICYTIGDFINDNPEFISTQNNTDGFIRKKDLYNKYVFWDIDGTLAPYRFNGHVGDPCGTDNGMSLKEIDDGIFLKRKPSKFMQKIMAKCGSKCNIIMGHCQNQKEMDDKQKWLDFYFPYITERNLTLQSVPKYKTILDYCKKHEIELKDVVFVDDVIPFLREAERHGISSWHISSFLDYN